MAGRKPLGPELVQHLEGSAHAKERFQAMLETLVGRSTIAEACERLGIGEAMFHRLRIEALQAGLNRLEPRPIGRPPQETSSEAARVAELEDQLRQLDQERQTAEVRLEIAQVLAPPQERPSGKKTTERKRRRRQRKARLQAQEEIAMNAAEQVELLRQSKLARWAMQSTLAPWATQARGSTRGRWLATAPERAEDLGTPDSPCAHSGSPDRPPVIPGRGRPLSSFSLAGGAAEASGSQAADSGSAAADGVSPGGPAGEGIAKNNEATEAARPARGGAAASAKKRWP